MIPHASLLTVAIAATLLVGGTRPAVAQTPAPSGTRLENITVIAPRVTYERSMRNERAAPRRVQVTQLSAMVDVHDLDLTRIADMQTMKTRVEEAAKRVCDQLTDRYPMGEPDREVCASRASADAMARAQQVLGSGASGG